MFFQSQGQARLFAGFPAPESLTYPAVSNSRAPPNFAQYRSPDTRLES